MCLLNFEFGTSQIDWDTDTCCKIKVYHSFMIMKQGTKLSLWRAPTPNQSKRKKIMLIIIIFENKPKLSSNSCCLTYCLHLHTSRYSATIHKKDASCSKAESAEYWRKIYSPSSPIVTSQFERNFLQRDNRHYFKATFDQNEATSLEETRQMSAYLSINLEDNLVSFPCIVYLVRI